MRFEIGKLKLSSQRALLVNVTAKLRAVCVKIQDSSIIIRFYYDKELSEDDRECSESAMDQIIADFPAEINGIEILFDYEIIRIDYPEKPPLIGYWVYFRFDN